MSRFRLNVAANLVGQGWSAVMGLAFVPVYTRLMGIEAYGLVGFYMALAGALQLLDFGLTPTTNREMARYSVEPTRAAEARDFMRTFEGAYWAVGLAIGAAIAAAAPWIAEHWVRAGALPDAVVTRAVLTMGCLAAVQWPLSFYQGALLGLQRQTALNVVLVTASTVRNAGAALALVAISPSVTTFFGWLVGVCVAQVLVTRALVWRSLSRAGGRPRFRRELAARVWRFAVGMSGITASGLVLTQLDKVVLSRTVPLAAFGYYTLAGVAVSGLTVIIVPLFNAMFPRFSSLVALGEHERLRELYHRCTRALAVVMLSAAAVIALFAFDLIFCWTGSVETAHAVAPVLRVLVIGTALNGLMYLPYTLQLAYGWTAIGLRINCGLVALFVPALLVLAPRYGGVGAAAGWAGVNALYMAVGVPLTHRRLLRGDAVRWLASGVAPAAAAAGAAALAVRAAVPDPTSRPAALAGLAVAALTTVAAAALSAPEVRERLAGGVAHLASRHP